MTLLGPAGMLLSVACDVMVVSSFIHSTPIRTFDDLMMAKTFFPTSIRSGVKRGFGDCRYDLIAAGKLDDNLGNDRSVVDLCYLPLQDIPRAQLHDSFPFGYA